MHRSIYKFTTGELTYPIIFCLILFNFVDTIEEALHYEKEAEEQSTFETDDEESGRTNNRFLSPPQPGHQSHKLSVVTDSFSVPQAEFQFDTTGKLKFLIY